MLAIHFPFHCLLAAASTALCFAAAWSMPEAFGRFLTAEVDKWARVVKVSGAKVD